MTYAKVFPHLRDDLDMCLSLFFFVLFSFSPKSVMLDLNSNDANQYAVGTDRVLAKCTFKSNYLSSFVDRGKSMGIAGVSCLAKL